MADYASWWDNPESGDDAPVVRHAPDQNNYHVPDSDMLSKIRGSKVGRFAIIPAANKDGTSKGFDASVAGPVHIDPHAPDGGVIFDPNSVTQQDINKAIANSYYPHQAFYQLGIPAKDLGIGKNSRQFADPEEMQARSNSRMPNSYVVPKSAEDGQQIEAPVYAADGYGTAPASYNPLFAQEAHRVNPAPPLSSLGQPPRLNNGAMQPAVPIPQPQQMPQQMPPPQQPVYQQPMYQQPMYAPPQMDPNIQAMMHAMVGMQQQLAALTQQRPVPQTTGMSPNPLPVGQPPMLSTQPVEMRRQRQRTQVGQPAYPGDEEFDDETARPIRKQVHRKKQTQEIDEEEDEERQEEDHPPRRARQRNANSLVERDQRERQQTVDDYEEVQGKDRPRSGVIAGFETLNVPWITGPVANKARKQVFFEIPNAGKHLARYHDVIESEHCVVLVFDTRYEEGTQYLPPDLQEEKIKLHCPGLKKTFTVSSMGFSYPFGVFDNVILVKHSVEELEISEDSR